MCATSSNLFGCVGLRKKQYCILNKQYTREEYEKKVLRIKEQMEKVPYIDKKGRVYKYGEFFPAELSPFAYNETLAQEYFPKTKEESIQEGFSWRDAKERNIIPTMKAKDIPDHIEEALDSIASEIITCLHEGECNDQCTGVYRIISKELVFYKKMNLPLPRLCPKCRHYERLKQRTPLRTYHRSCQCNQRPTTNDKRPYENTAEHFHRDKPCPNEFETTYSFEQKEIVYCEKCYQQEVA